MRTGFLIILVGLLLGLSSLQAAEVPGSQATAPVDLEADQLDFDESTGRYHASGDVRLSQGETVLTTDELWWNQQTGEIEANGQALLRSPGEVLSGTRFQYNLQQGTGVVEEGEATWQEKSLRINGARLERLGPNRFHIQDGRFTVCDAERPAWSVGLKTAEVTVGGYLNAKHALIYVKDVPAFYLPYLVVPVKTERESGFLLPRIGYSSKRGAEFSTAWYQVIAPNQDATFYLDHLAHLGTGAGVEYRYLFRHLRGEIKLYNTFMREGSDRSSLAWEQISEFRDGLRAVIDAELVSSRDYYSDFAEEVGDYNQQTAISTFFVSQRLTRSSLTASYKYIKDLESETSTPWQAAPQLDFALQPQRLGPTPFLLGLDARYNRFDRESAPSAQRVMVRPELALLQNLAGFEVEAVYGYRQRHYLEIEDGLRESYGSGDFTARLSGRLSRVFRASNSEWLHSIEPEINYRYVEEVADLNLPDYDLFDSSLAANEVGYALVNRLTGKWQDDEGGVVRREVLWLRLSQAYLLDNPTDSGNDFGALRSELILRPTANSSLNFDLLFDVDSGLLSDSTITGNLADTRGNSLQLTYHKRDSLTGSGDVDNANLTLETALLKPLYLGYQQRYDFIEANQLEQVVDLDLRQQCWGLKLTYREREDEQSVVLTLSLGGIGEIGKIGANLRSE